MSYQKPNDPMMKIIIAVSSLVLLIAVAVLLMSLINTIQRNTIAADTVVDTSEVSEPVAKEKTISKAEATANKNIKPIGVVDVVASAQPAASGGAPRSGKEIYDTTCTACHASGVLEAPKLGDKAAWEPRMVNGFDALLASSIAGKGAMPPKGGNAGLSDDEMKATIAYMLKESGIDAGVSADAPVAPTAADATPVAAATEATAEAAPTVEAVAPATTATPAVEATATAETPAVETTATEVAPEQPAAPEVAPAPQAPEQPAAPAVDEVKTEVAPVSAEATPAMGEVVETAEPTATVATSGSANGEELYKTKCFVCHAAGVAGAPILGNKEQWAPRIAQGIDVLYNVAMNGKGAMPPKGTATDSSEDEIKATVDYMVSSSQ